MKKPMRDKGIVGIVLSLLILWGILNLILPPKIVEIYRTIGTISIPDRSPTKEPK